MIKRVIIVEDETAAQVNLRSMLTSLIPGVEVVEVLESVEESIDYFSKEVDADVVFMDPPRAGSDEKFIKSLIKCNPKRVVYISCDPETLGRDCAVFREEGYEIGEVQPVDLFPRTGHIENVVCLTKQNELSQRA